MTATRKRSNRPLYILLAALGVVGAAVLIWFARGDRAGPIAADPSLPPVQSEGYVLGNPQAPVEVIEFADFECPACASYATLTGPDVKARLVSTGQVRLRFMDFPLPSHRNTWEASHAAACANDQGKFWEMHDAIFQHQDRWNTQATRNPRSVLRPLAQQIGLDMGRYDQCMEQRTHQAKIQAHLRKGTELGVNSTPSFVIGGRIIPGAISYDQFKRHVDQALAQGPRVSTAGTAGASGAPGSAAARAAADTGTSAPALGSMPAPAAGAATRP